MLISEMPQDRKEKLAGETVNAIMERVQETLHRRLLSAFENLWEIGPDDILRFEYKIDIAGDSLQRFASGKSNYVFITDAKPINGKGEIYHVK